MSTRVLTNCVNVKIRLMECCNKW